LKDAAIGDPDIRLSLSKMTPTSQMARLVLIEQIYRAFTLIKGLKYHK
jgi:23S rRNA (pseudouridine1915-N3)-methyltransferase